MRFDWVSFPRAIDESSNTAILIKHWQDWCIDQLDYVLYNHRHCKQHSLSNVESRAHENREVGD
jgi:hypothetical protein